MAVRPASSADAVREDAGRPDRSTPATRSARCRDAARPDPQPRPDRAVPALPDGGVRRLAEHAGGLPVGHRPVQPLAEGACPRARWRELDDRDLAGYVDYLRAMRAWPPSSVGRHLASLSTFFRFLIFDGRLAENVAKLLVAPAVWDRLPTVLGPAAVDRLLDAPSPDTPLGRRDRAALETLYATGCRASEVVGPPAGRPRPRARARRGASARGTRSGSSRSAREGPRGARGLSARATARSWSRGGPRRATVFVSRTGRPLSRVGLWRIVKGHAPAAGLTAAGPSARTRSGTASPPTCWPAAPTSASSRRCSATPRSPRPRSTPGSRSRRSRPSTAGSTRGTRGDVEPAVSGCSAFRRAWRSRLVELGVLLVRRSTRRTRSSVAAFVDVVQGHLVFGGTPCRSRSPRAATSPRPIRRPRSRRIPGWPPRLRLIRECVRARPGRPPRACDEIGRCAGAECRRRPQGLVAQVDCSTARTAGRARGCLEHLGGLPGRRIFRDLVPGQLDRLVEDPWPRRA